MGVAEAEAAASTSEDDDLFYLSAGPLAAIVIGMGLVPLRGFTVASNFTFVFVVLTIVVAEFGGRRAALATAVVSTLSLDFFLTEPYLKLTIASKHDVYALCGLAVCGAVAAKLASGRGGHQRALRTLRAHLDLLDAGVRELDETGPGLEKLLDALRRAAPVMALTLRDEKGRLVASSGHAGERPVPKETLQPEELLGAPASPPRTLSPEGSRVVLKTRARIVGSLDVWGEGTLLTADVRLLLADLATLLAVRLDRGTVEPS
jgi:hypothetical protein